MTENIGLLPTVADAAGALRWVEDATYANCSATTAFKVHLPAPMCSHSQDPCHHGDTWTGCCSKAARPLATRLTAPALTGIDVVLLP